MLTRAEALGCEVVRLKANRLAGLAGKDPRRAYTDAKNTLAIVVAPPTNPPDATRSVTADPMPPDAPMTTARAGRSRLLKSYGLDTPEASQSPVLCGISLDLKDMHPDSVSNQA